MGEHSRFPSIGQFRDKDKIRRGSFKATLKTGYEVNIELLYDGYGLMFSEPTSSKNAGSVKIVLVFDSLADISDMLFKIAEKVSDKRSAKKK